MKKVILYTVIIYCITQVSTAQVGVGTTNPQAMLEVVSSNSGVLIPRVTLTQLNVMAPVTSASNSELVYNDATTPTSSAIAKHLQVTKGYYYWDAANSIWVHIADDVKIPSFETTFTQATELSVTSTSFLDIPGLNNSFTAPYDGTYQIIFTGGYGVGDVNDTAHKYEIGIGEATFRLVLDGNNIDRVVGARSFYFKTGTTQHSNLIQWVTIYANVNLTAGQTCTVNAQLQEFSKNNLSTNSVVGKNNGSGVSDPKYRSEIQVALISN